MLIRSRPLASKALRYASSTSNGTSARRREKSLRRALLYIPGSSEKMLAKSINLKADGLTFDLEDSVSMAAKPKARKLVSQHLQRYARGTQERIVRINGRGTGQLAIDDLAMIQGLQIDAVMLPKTETAEDVQWLAGKLPAGVQIIAMIESASAIMNLKSIASAHKQLTGLVFAAEDFAASMQITRSPSLRELLFARQAVVTAARAYGLDSIDLVCTSYKDLERLKEECIEGASFGYSGKQAIHPAQIKDIKKHFSPSKERVRWAQGLLKRWESEERGAFEFEGKMIDAPVILSAQRIVDLHHRGLEPIRGLILGAPGAGKGTQAKHIMGKYPDISILSSGDLLRDHMRRGTDLGKRAQDKITRGELIDDDTMCDLVINTIKERGFTAKSFFLDGFPRTEAQAATLDNYLSELGTPLNFVVNLDVPYSVIIDRIVNRWIHAPSGRTYNLTYNPPQVAGLDDETGEQLTKRLDDNVETFQKRLAEYDAMTTPLKDYYDEQGILNTFTGETSDVIWPQLEEALYKVQ
ncbi:Pyruvate/Phosphoenolpyruvate kinase-like domain-containing protein [Protomyces lactucae-debilis]|uniref:GTP:AMP phosphotransferase, mitochondrial n=1 Tax=Protomyces lactucae-debilis TaxID=2754530 RepID=A0A1Y2FKY4_PROLT|nr:Pyruvate/Phosphoenolpyruvate kinase-like domain-containing protein [Protomyces lactucae-debilis]ORY84247.1 Pyruvate/Phosphoenolpyruvate kinase-like domain-containing protein [Protomyces lactucae-debilis]